MNREAGALQIRSALAWRIGRHRQHGGEEETYKQEFTGKCLHKCRWREEQRSGRSYQAGLRWSELNDLGKQLATNRFEN